ncbi:MULTISPECIES: 3-hydroxybutyrate dehydrogenase [Thioclava]|uniref:3-hydroxybutyrate dehydrogenase n=1 Tax=Thioclava TaxID=285107 RepID=UPI000C5A52E7|nr:MULTISPECIES: 3-hydroxybutyrate dehydrogenase [Thioclava]MAQ38856.1 3-hydroxybutyrate dehydrogenase [Thioclava sp.]|tara:strand:+ start:468 stop:1271 length:804 start_codon:yes stop_codon:yes gene_type:complete
MSRLDGKTALVTGSVQGIGLAIAKSLAEAGARIALHGLADAAQVAEATAVLEAAGAPEVKFFGADMADPAQIDAMMDAIEAWGGADILVNNAGIQRTASLAEATPEIWNAILAVNLSGAFHTMRRAMPDMAERGYGRVVNIASVHGLVASANKAPYVASKFGLVGMSRVAALEYAQAGTREAGGVTVNCICPGWTETDILGPQIAERAAAHGGDRAAGIADLLAEKQPTRRLSDPSEIGALALWLCAPIAHNVTGTSIPVDGGWTTQ